MSYEAQTHQVPHNLSCTCGIINKTNIACEVSNVTCLKLKKVHLKNLRWKVQNPFMCVCVCVRNSLLYRRAEAKIVCMCLIRSSPMHACMAR